MKTMKINGKPKTAILAMRSMKSPSTSQLTWTKRNGCIRGCIVRQQKIPVSLLCEVYPNIILTSRLHRDRRLNCRLTSTSKKDDVAKKRVARVSLIPGVRGSRSWVQWTSQTTVAAGVERIAANETGNDIDWRVSSEMGESKYRPKCKAEFSLKQMLEKEPGRSSKVNVDQTNPFKTRLLGVSRIRVA